MSTLEMSIRQMFTTANIRSSLAIIVTVFVFYIVWTVVHKPKVTVEDMGVVTAIIGMESFILGYYFGSSKTETDRVKRVNFKEDENP